MSILEVALPDDAIVCTGKQISFKAACDCVDITGITIDGTTYTLVDALGNDITTNNSFAEGSMVSFILDTDENKAYLQNGFSDCIGKIEFTSSEWTGSTNSLYTLTKEVGLAKVISVYKGNDTSGYKAVEVDNIEISAGGTLTVTSPATFEGFILLSSSIAFDSSVAETVNSLIDGKVNEAIDNNIDDKINTAVIDQLSLKANTADVYTKSEIDTKITEAVDLSNYVDLNSSQEITGAKTFSGNNIYTGAIQYIRAGSNIRWFKNNVNNIVGTLNQSNYSGNANTATKATQDGSGNVIVDTYATKTEVSALITGGTEELTAGTSPLASGTLYVMYEE